MTAQSILGVHLILRNTRSWSNSELSKKCKLQEYGTYGTTEETDGDPDSPSQGTGSDSQGTGSTTGGDSKGDNPSGGSQTGTEGSDGGGSDGDYELK